VHLLAVGLLGRWPPGVGAGTWFEAVPAVLALLAAAALVLRGDRRPLAVACLAAWAAVAFTLPAYFLGLAFVPGAVLMSLPYRSTEG
jgi:hypothetical protein